MLKLLFKYRRRPSYPKYKPSGSSNPAPKPSGLVTLAKAPKAKAPKRVAKPKATASASKAKTPATISKTLATTSETPAAKAKRQASTSKTPATKTKTLATSSKTPVAATNTKATIKTKANDSDFYAKDEISKPPASAAKTYIIPETIWGSKLGDKSILGDPNKAPTTSTKTRGKNPKDTAKEVPKPAAKPRSPSKYYSLSVKDLSIVPYIKLKHYPVPPIEINNPKRKHPKS
ncbi:hypothetical protein BT67DRAFT_437440 [Trichocladium antarcticum]|uniref:Uncharacterized protein n=1 Tax=Trichocladium antarcticum TaxID=1450529 RepID=A0AAN6Z9B8_9PEZI|nr:hypothetical protein BT67DRAFT_437440 [Trichocladium antarcticum]